MDNADQPATKADIEALRLEMQASVESLRGEVKASVESLRADLIEVIRDSQTEVLRAFYGYTETNDIKQRDLQASDASLRERLSAVERRVTEIEHRLLTPPPPQPPPQ